MKQSTGTKILLIITTIAFSILAAYSASDLFWLTILFVQLDQHSSTPMSWLDYLRAYIFWMIPVAFAGGQWLAWRGYTLKKTIVIVLGMGLSFSPIMVFLILWSYLALACRYY